MKFFALCLSLLATQVAAQSRVETAFDEGEPRIRVSLVADRAGDDLRVGVHFEPDEHWHVYWKNPGESGVSTDVVLEGAPFGELQWPIPQRYEAPGPILTYGYDEVVLFASTESNVPIEVHADVDFLVCEVDCIPARVQLSATVEPDASSEALERFAGRVPEPGEVTLAGAWPALGQTTRAEITCEDCTIDPSRVFFERVDGVGIRTRDHVELSARGETSPQTLRGVLEADVNGAPRYIAFETELQAATFETHVATFETGVASAQTSAPELSLVWALLFAFLGGLLLNLMPCVLPVLTVKVLGMLRLAAEPHEARKHGWAYAAGVVGSMAGLAVLVIAFRAAGHQLGWGFHLQEPRFVAAMVVLLVLLALGFFGVVHFRVSTTRLDTQVDNAVGLKRSIGEGLLAVLLATPCTAPFLGGAVGYALTQPAWVVVATFVLVGLGLAAPFVLLVHVPALIERLPKPGAWMETLERLLGFALLGTAVWLAWIYGQTMGVDGVATLMGACLAVAFGAWLWGRWPGWRAGTFVLVLAVASAALLATRTPVPSEAHAEWRAWEPANVRAELAQGRTAMVVFTADWCVTCKVNERFVLQSDEVRAQLDDITVFVADWTQRDDRIRQELSRHARAGVPLTLLYRPQAPDSPEVLPELLTTEIVLDALRRAEG